MKINIFDFSKKSINFYKNIELKDNDNKNISLKNYGNETKTIINDLNKTILNIPIVFYLDDESVPFIYTTIISILENKYNSTHYSFYLLVSSNISKNNENNINKIHNKYQCSINFIYIEKIFEDLTMNISNITISNYYRLLIPDLMPRELNKCIYLDADICVLKDLSELYNIDLKDYYVAGVVDAGYYFDEKENCKRLNITSMKNYINEGVLVLNLEQIRKDNMTKKFIEFSSINYNLQSKDILNVTCYGKILSLPPKYNAMVLLFKENSKRLRELFNEEEIFEANNAPSIIHYSDQKKPWNNIRVYMDKYWWDVAKKTPFANDLFTRENIYKYEIKRFWHKTKKKSLDLENPRTFNEKIQWLKLYDSTPIKTKLNDKYLVREWIKEKIGEKYLIPLLGVYDKFDEIDFDKLPNQFVIKCNHGSHYNIIVKDKSSLDLHHTESKIEKWMDENYGFISGLELQYRDIPRKIIIEKYLDDGNGDLNDYKITCFNGKPYIIWIDNARNSNHTRNLYDMNWNQLPYKINDYPTFPSPEKPKCFEEMVQLSSILSRGFIYVRVDFFIVNDKLYFGEMTFTSSSGTSDITPEDFEKNLSSLIKLPNTGYNIDTGQYYNLSNNFDE